MIFRLKNSSSTQLVLTPQSYHDAATYVLKPGLTIRNVLIYSNFKFICIVSCCFPNICFSFVTHFAFQIIYNIILSGSQLLCKFPIRHEPFIGFIYIILTYFESLVTAFINSWFSAFKI